MILRVVQSQAPKFDVNVIRKTVERQPRKLSTYPKHVVSTAFCVLEVFIGLFLYQVINLGLQRATATADCNISRNEQSEDKRRPADITKGIDNSAIIV